LYRFETADIPILLHNETWADPMTIDESKINQLVGQTLSDLGGALGRMGDALMIFEARA
jgi:hypothetical protein